MFEIHELYVVHGLRVCEYTTRYGVRRFDIQPWRGERELKLPVEVADGIWETRTYEIQKLNVPRLIFNPTERQLDLLTDTRPRRLI